MLDRLADLAHTEGDVSYWTSDIATFVGGEGQSASIETSGLAILALQRSNTHPDLSNKALLYLVHGKGSSVPGTAPRPPCFRSRRCWVVCATAAS